MVRIGPGPLLSPSGDVDRGVCATMISAENDDQRSVMGSIETQRRTPTARRTRALLSGLVLGALALLTGCMEINMEVDLRDNGSGALTFETVVPKEMVGFVEMAGQPLDEDFVRDQFVQGAPKSVSDMVDVSVERTDGAVKIRVSIRFAGIEELGSMLVDGSQTEPLFSKFDVNKTDDEWVFEAVPDDLTSALGTDESSGDPAVDDMFGDTDLFGDLEMNFTMKFSGDVIESNADEIEGNSATWKLDETVTGPFTAKAKVGGGSNTMLIAGLVVLGIVVVAGGLLLVRSRSSKGSGGSGTTTDWTHGSAATAGVPGASPSAWGSQVPGASTSAWGSQVPGQPTQPTGPIGTAMPTSPPLAPVSPPEPMAQPMGPPVAQPVVPEPIAQPVAQPVVPEPVAPVIPPEPTTPPVVPPTTPQVQPVPNGPPVVPTPVQQPEEPASTDTQVEPGWYPDPWAESEWRWYDGVEWTSNTR